MIRSSEAGFGCAGGRSDPKRTGMNGMALRGAEAWAATRIGGAIYAVFRGAKVTCSRSSGGRDRPVALRQAGSAVASSGHLRK